MVALNPQRGDVAVRLGGKAYVMRPTFEALAEIEGITGRGIVDLLNRFSRKEFGAKDTAAVIFAAIKSGGEIGANYEAVGRMVVSDGLVNFIPAISAFLANAVTGGETPDPGEGGAAAGETTESRTAAS